MTVGNGKDDKKKKKKQPKQVKGKEVTFPGLPSALMVLSSGDFFPCQPPSVG